MFIFLCDVAKNNYITVEKELPTFEEMVDYQLVKIQLFLSLMVCLNMARYDFWNIDSQFNCMIIM